MDKVRSSLPYIKLLRGLPSAVKISQLLLDGFTVQLADRLSAGVDTEDLHDLYFDAIRLVVRDVKETSLIDPEPRETYVAPGQAEEDGEDEDDDDGIVESTENPQVSTSTQQKTNTIQIQPNAEDSKPEVNDPKGKGKRKRNVIQSDVNMDEAFGNWNDDEDEDFPDFPQPEESVKVPLDPPVSSGTQSSKDPEVPGSQNKTEPASENKTESAKETTESK